jgi:hypothetical protein
MSPGGIGTVSVGKLRTGGAAPSIEEAAIGAVAWVVEAPFFGMHLDGDYLQAGKGYEFSSEIRCELD